jgi:hypothetical protein
MERGNESCSMARSPTIGAVSPGLSGADQSLVRLGEATVTDIFTNDEISLLRSLEKKSRTITGTLTNKRYDRLEIHKRDQAALGNWQSLLRFLNWDPVSRVGTR